MPEKKNVKSKKTTSKKEDKAVKPEVKEAKSDEIVIKKPDTLNKIRENPWIVSTFVLAILLILVLVFGGVGYSGVTGNAVAETEVTEKVVGFLNQQVDGDVEFNSISNEGSYYEIIVSYQGDQVPLQASLDGDYIFAQLVPTSGLPPSGQEVGSQVPGNVPNNIGQAPIEVDITGAPVMGDPNAPVTIVEFSDYQCPFCARFWSQTLPLLEKNYIDTGKVKLVFMDFPLQNHPLALPAAIAAECVRDQGGDEAYYDMHDLLFENQASLSVTNFKMYAEELGYDIDECLDNQEHSDEILEELAYGASLGITGTPGFIINGVSLSGAQPYNIFEQIIETELAKSNSL